MHTSAVERLHSLIREVPDFRKKGISFKDFTRCYKTRPRWRWR